MIASGVTASHGYERHAEETASHPFRGPPVAGVDVPHECRGKQ